MIRSAMSLGVIQIAGYVVPFATLAAAGRLAPPLALSGFLYVQSLAALLAIIVEYGFHLSAVRMAGEAITTGTERRTYSSIHAAKAVLLVIALAIAVSVAAFGTQITVTPDMLLGVCMAIFSYGARPLWYFQANETYWRLIKIEIAASVVALASVTVAAQHIPHPGALAIAWVIPRFIATMVLILGIHATHGFEWIPLRMVMTTLRESFPLFLHKASANAVHLGVPVVIAYMLTRPELLGFQRAERIFTAAQSVLLVVSQASYALIVKQNGDHSEARRTALRATFYQLGVSSLAAVLVALTAPWLVLLFWGGWHADTTQLLRLYAIGLPLLAINAALGLNYLLPRKRDVVVVGAAIAGAASTMALVHPLTSYWGPQGGIFSILLGEFIMFIVMLTALRASRHTRYPA
ncbi:lipopolysaccharide biosynthesis protein [Roseateles sp. LKC17W]|uniref:Lipopolysaccharide biosynthesis protein n=1 Tax=Pelomonas margarita TaxID=3299031 RepID=A0ABW7FK41_9BURK